MHELKQKIYRMVRPDLEGIESALLQNLNPHIDLVSQTARHILFSGGKRLRPLLTVLSARICGYTGTDTRNFSTVFEYLHAATLLHDDLVDGAALRRGKPVAHSLWGNETAVLVGDFLLSRALSVASKTDRMEVIRVIAEVTEKMSQGEIHQLMRKGKIDLDESEYLEIISSKTAVLIEAACRVGAIIAGADEDKKRSLAAYGLNLGMAFQMADDLLDYTADASVLGKEIGADLKEGKLTLPVIRALAAASPEDRTYMETVINQRDFSADTFRTLVTLLHRYQGIAYTRELADQRIDAAKSALSVFEDSPTKELLTYIAEYAVNREF